MRAITFATISFLLVGFTLQTCTPGCLRCSNTGDCLACDTARSTFLRTSTCYTITIPNCASINQKGDCIQCNAGYTLTAPSTCSAIASKILNCALYASGSTCAQCVEGAIMTAGQCRIVTNPIPFCRRYNSDGTCAKCGANYIVSANMTACALLNITNCQSGSFIRCRACANGYLYSNNTYLSNLFQYDLAASAANNLNNYNAGPWAPQSVCQSTYKQTCLDPLSKNCLPTIVASNQPPNTVDNTFVRNCINYGAAFACLACEQGYKLSSPSSCLPVPNVNNCTAYNNNDAIGACISCVQGMYVNNANQCVARTNLNIAGCIALSDASDVCATCDPALVRTIDGLGCLPSVPNCQTHMALTAYYPLANCILCNRLFFINITRNATNCTLGTIANCTTYSTYDNSCAACSPGNYLSNGLCAPHKMIAGCLNYLITTGVKCASCSGTSIPFTLLNKCVPITPRAFCTDYSPDGSACTACTGTNYVNAAGACVAIPVAFNNCITYDPVNSQCTGCAPGFQVNATATPNMCSIPFDYIIGGNSRCAVVSNLPNASWNPTATNSQIKCTACNETSFPFAPSFNEAICVKNEQLSYNTGFTNVVNCVRYGKSLASGNPIVCLECAKTFFLSGYQALGPFTIATTCVSACLSTTNAIILDDFFGFNNICVPILATGYVQLSASCYKYVRKSAGALLAASANFAEDFVCLNVTPSLATAVYPTSFLLYDVAAALAGSVRYEKVTYNAAPYLATGATYVPVWDFSNGFGNTADTSLTYPLVFNYRGLLTANSYAAPAIIRLNLAAEIISASNTKSNLFTNCDIITNTDLVKVGNAFSGTNLAYAPATIGTTYYHCYRCAFGFGLTFTTGATQALTSPFPSCAAVASCTVTQVWGGLPRYLNSLLSCHVCANSGAILQFPTIAIEVDAVTNTGIVVGFQPDQSVTLTGTTRTVNARSGFKCAAAPTKVVAGITSSSNVTIPACDVYANIRSLTAWATSAADATVVTSNWSAADNNVCLACNPGFFPTYLDTLASSESAAFTTYGLPGWIVTACNPSQFCDPSAVGMFNGCPKCNAAVMPIAGGGTAYNDYTMANCVLTSASNCLMAEGYLDAVTSFDCTACKSGYYLNPSGQCDQIQVPNQLAGSSFVSNAYLKLVTSAWLASPSASLFATKDLRIAYLQKFNTTNYGVKDCNTGYTKFPINSNIQAVCAFSFFLNSTRMRFPASTYFIPNCAKYIGQTAVQASVAPQKCFECLLPFVASLDGTKCVLFPVPNTCKYAANTQPASVAPVSGMPTPGPVMTPVCAECLPGFLFVSGVCLNPSIPNCLTYTQTATNGVLPITCALCNDTFAPNAAMNECVRGPVEACRTYSNSLTCTSCLNDFTLVTLKNRPYCLPIPRALNCTTMDATAANSFNFQCTRCNNTNVTAYLIAPYTTASVYADNLDVCLPYNNINNCLLLAPAGRDNALVVSFGCAVCAKEYYWEAGLLFCKRRAVLPPSCITFSLTSDTCTACGSKFTLNAAGTTCTAYPTGYLNCFSLLSTGDCGQCNPGFFLNGDACIPVARPILGCMFYFNEGVCSQCGLGRVAVNGGTLCAFPVVTNCTTWAADNSCSSCPSGTFLSNVTVSVPSVIATSLNIPTQVNPITGANITSTSYVGICVNLTVANCSVGTTAATCSVCNQDFYLNSNLCRPVDFRIIGCSVYFNATSCLTCSPGTVLNFNGRSCVPNNFNNLADAYCVDSFVDNRPICTACKPGFYFDFAGNCTQCGQIGAGCDYCNPNAPDQCLMCSTGYTMDANFVCSVQAAIPSNPAPV